MIRIGTRKSKLALIQTEIVKNKILEFLPEEEIEIVHIVTKGDMILDRSLASFGGKGVFTQEIEEQLLDERIDIAVHSAKDIPMELAKGLTLGAIIERDDPRDVLITRSGIKAKDLPADSVVGTSSLRRELQIKKINKALQIKTLRGNVPTRLKKLMDGEYDGIILAAAGLKRLGLDKEEGLFYEYFDAKEFLPAAGQGILAIETREHYRNDLMEYLNDEAAKEALLFEREFLTAIGGSCNAPCGVWFRREEDNIFVSGMYAKNAEAQIVSLMNEKEPANKEQEAANEKKEPANKEQEAANEKKESANKEQEAANEKKEPANKEQQPSIEVKELTIEGISLSNQNWIETGRKQAAEKMADLCKQESFEKGKKSFVSLVGAGPGHKDFISVKGLNCVKNADIIVYDDLISPSILNAAKLNAQLIYVGKRLGKHSMKQSEMNELLVSLAESGKYIVRLKGGDPFVFGRGHEEAKALTDHGISFEVVSGITSAVSVPAQAGISVTNRELASSLHIITGHENPLKEKEALDYEVLAKEEGTLVFLMGLTHLEEIVTKLIKAGKDKTTEAAVIQKGFSARQKAVYGNLENIVTKVKEASLQTPAIILIGKVASNEAVLWQEEPLYAKEKRVLFTGTRQMVKSLEEAFEPLKMETISLSLVETRPVKSGIQWEKELLGEENGTKEWKSIDAKTKGSGTRKTGEEEAVEQWITFTSGVGVREFFKELKEQGVDYRKLALLHFAVVGPSTKKVLSEYGFLADLMPEEYTSKALGEALMTKFLDNSKTKKIIHIRAKQGSDALYQELNHDSIVQKNVILYETYADMRRKDELLRVLPDLDYLVLTSGSGVKALVDMVKGEKAFGTNKAKSYEGFTGKIISIGKETSKAVMQLGLCELLKVAEGHFVTANEASASGIADTVGKD